MHIFKVYNLLNCSICETITTSNSINVGLTSKTFLLLYNFLPLSHSSAGKESAWNAGDPSSIPGSGRYPGKGIGYPLQYFWVFLVAQTVKNLPAMQEIWVQSWVGKGHGHPLQRVAKRGCKEWDMTKQRSTAQSSVSPLLPGWVKYKMQTHVVTDRNQSCQLVKTKVLAF